MQSSGRIDDESEPGRTDFSADQADKMSSRRKACNECKQQKVQPLSAFQHHQHTHYLSRIIVLGADVSDLIAELTMAFVGLENEGKQSTDLESELHSLREQLRATQSNASTSSQHNETNWPVPAPVGTPGSVFNAINQTDAGLNFSPVRNDSPAASMNFPPATLGSSVTNDADLQCLTTRPGIDPPTQHRASLFPQVRPRALGNIILQIEEIDELFNIRGSKTAEIAANPPAQTG
ncbi:fungal specific transcription factor factor domain-containing protein [Fusarium mundagurra]|uniref:Fungal specific transcription factor factor domain-containing protein n=1 Tax=Fusarium mundagurra TaxID=1567541 RepID=A0A8H6D719_9HYPO|nr:fungal specific transcription factor factor domain-containing protein [Fusarium mundagurra]